MATTLKLETTLFTVETTKFNGDAEFSHLIIRCDPSVPELDTLRGLESAAVSGDRVARIAIGILNEQPEIAYSYAIRADQSVDTSTRVYAD